jgi:RHS repeat-associated protein
VRETDPSGVAIADYVHAGTPLSQQRGGATSFYLKDGYGSTRMLTDSAGAPTDTFDFDAFGNLLARSGSTANPYLYNGQQFEPDAGLHYLRARYYDAATGRFTSVDPFPGLARDPVTLHPSLSARNDAVIFSDPSGEFSLIEAAIVVGIQGVAAGLSIAIQGHAILGTKVALVGASIAVPGLIVAWAPVSPAVLTAVPAAPQVAQRIVGTLRPTEITEVVRRASGTLEQISQEAEAVLPEIEATAPQIANAVVRVQPTVQRGTDFFLARGPDVTRIYKDIGDAYVRSPQLLTLQRIFEGIVKQPGGQLVLCALVASEDLLRGTGPAAGEPLYASSFAAAIARVLLANGVVCDRRG